MKRNTLAAAFLLSALTSTAMAEGFYGAVDIGEAAYEDACSGLPMGFSCNDTDTAFRFGAGYQFTPNMGIEINYGNLGASKISGTDTSAGFPIAASGENKVTALQIAAIGTFPVTDSFSLIGKLGIARTTVDMSATASGSGITISLSDSETSTELAYGIGAQFDISKSVAVRAQYESLGEVGDVTVSLLSVGVISRF